MAAVSAGELTLFSVSTGDPIWHSGADDYVTAPLIANGYVIEGRSDGTVDARELQDGRVVWSGRAGAGLTAPDEHNAFTLSGLAEGDGALVVPAGTTLTAFVPAGDTNVAITSGPAPDAVIGPTATFSFDSDVPNAQYTCTLDGDSAPCTSPTTFTGLDDGKHHFSVEIAFATSGAAATAFRVDAVGPSVLLERFRPMETTKATATAHWSASDDRSGVQEYQLRVRRAPFGTALPSWSVRSPTTAGSATLHLRPSSRLCASVRAEDGVGNWSGWSSPQCVRRVAGTS